MRADDSGEVCQIRIDWVGRVAETRSMLVSLVTMPFTASCEQALEVKPFVYEAALKAACRAAQGLCCSLALATVALRRPLLKSSTSSEPKVCSCTIHSCPQRASLGKRCCSSCWSNSEPPGVLK